MNEAGDIVIDFKLPTWADEGEEPGQSVYQITITKYEMGRIQQSYKGVQHIIVKSCGR
jgi:hypothetical protein